MTLEFDHHLSQGCFLSDNTCMVINLIGHNTKLEKSVGQLTQILVWENPGQGKPD